MTRFFALSDKTPESYESVTMPFFNSLKNEGLYFENMYSTNGSTAQTIFSLLTGQHLSKGINIYGTRSEVSTTINKLAPDKYTVFYHSYDANSYFPKQFLIKNSINFNDNKKEYYPSVEIKKMNEFLNELEKNKNKGFVGFYLNYNTHYPYYNNHVENYKEHSLGKKMFEQQTLGNIDKKRYYNSLSYFDTILKQFVVELKNKNVLEDTVLVFIGDHWQSFGQNGKWTHSGMLDDVLNVPALIWNPKFIKNESVEEKRIQADIVPTLLDILNISYDKNIFNGISIFDKNNRKYIYSEKKEMILIDTQTNEKIMIENNTCFKIIKNVENFINSEKKEICGEKEIELKKTLMKFENYYDNVLKL